MQKKNNLSHVESLLMKNKSTYDQLLTTDVSLAIWVQYFKLRHSYNLWLK